MNAEELERKATADRRKYIVEEVKKLIQLARQTYYRKDLTAEELKAIPKAETLGTMVSSVLKWEPKDIFVAVSEMFTDANLHGLNKQWEGFLNGSFWIVNAEKLKNVKAVFDLRPNSTKPLEGWKSMSLHEYITQNPNLLK